MIFNTIIKIKTFLLFYQIKNVRKHIITDHTPPYPHSTNYTTFNHKKHLTVKETAILDNVRN